MNKWKISFFNKITIMKVILMEPKDKINTNDKNNEDIILLNDEE